MALHQAFTLLGLARQGRTFSPRAVRAAPIIRYCALVLICFVAGALLYAWVFVRGTDDIAGGVAMGLVITVACVVVAAAAAVAEKLLQRALEMRSENDLTV